MPNSDTSRQKILVLYLSSSSLEAGVVAWSLYDGTGEYLHMPGDTEESPYQTGIEALKDGWRLIQASPLIQHKEGDEFKTGYFKYEFFFEKIISKEHD